MRADGEEKAKELRDRLERAIRLEDYEEAARLRDQLGGLEQRKSQG